MKRRSFLCHLGATASSLPFLPYPALTLAHPPYEEIALLLKAFSNGNDVSIKSLLERQEKDTKHPEYGGIVNGYGIHNPQNTSSFLQRLSGGLVSEYSEFYQDESLLEPMLRASEYLLQAQHPDGTIDLHTTNFHSTPDLAFSVEPASLAYTLLHTYVPSSTQAIQDNLQTYLESAGQALSIGGIHTPNHRWVVCMALARVHHLFPDPAYEARINEWLREKIDIDEDGQYTEQSTLVYSPIVNRSLITIARLANKPELLDPVRRNLEMSLYYIHANGEGVTEGSGRQDKYQKGTLHRYYYSYRYLALHDRNPRFAAMAQFLENQDINLLNYNLAYLLEDTDLKSPLPSASSLPTNYTKIFTGSDLVRIRRGERDATILAKNPVFFTFFNGEAALEGIRLASAFFGKGQFEGESLEQDGDKFVVRQWLEGPYYQPFAKEELKTTDGDWEKLPRDERPQSEIQKLLTEVRIRETEKGFQIDVSVLGTDRVPVALELAFRSGGTLEKAQPVENIPEAYLLTEGFGTFQSGKQKIRFGPGRAEHQWTQLRGALDKLDAQSVYLTGFTPFEHQLTIE
ncbi:hypothetical protein [Tunicatimonas pelagia]|uniref:hypothetical protein n=1 Tax=Tunicatimonas pelagia TaxID=931531 RepID=UPI0026666BFA|nr:hypothetical protein [Tunicatimonas pelagia]WKN46216.1 hypothetical protein P0M28_14785 [Tunicatimonas pelagia]